MHQVLQGNLNYMKPLVFHFCLHFSSNPFFSGKRAIGVEFVHQGRLKKVYANKEVILSAGAVGTPQILMLSGVGPKQHLQDMNVR